MAPPHITKFTNARVLRGGELVSGDLYVDASKGTILSPQSAFYSHNTTPDQTIDLANKILSPGFLDVQLNGAHGLDFSKTDPDFEIRLEDTNRKLIQSGVTSYVPTITSQLPAVYASNLPFLAASGSRDANLGSESLGVHVEGPFISPKKNGIHTPSVLTVANSFSDLENMYGSKYLNDGTIRKMTAAPELGAMTSLIPEIISHGIVFSIGHSDATFDEAHSALLAGATMVTHMFNAMRPFGHRDPGIFGLLGQSHSTRNSPNTSPDNSRPSTPRSAWQPTTATASSPIESKRSTPRSSLSTSSSISDPPPPSEVLPNGKPYFGLIADLIHLSPQTLAIAHHAHPQGSILVTDAMPLAGLPDGIYPWTNGENIIKKGPVLTLEKNGRIAGSAIYLIDCINNFKHALGDSVGWGEVLESVTKHPAEMLGRDVSQRKGALEAGMDADLVVLDERRGDGDQTELHVDQVWKFGVRVA